MHRRNRRSNTFVFHWATLAIAAATVSCGSVSSTEGVERDAGDAGTRDVTTDVGWDADVSVEAYAGDAASADAADTSVAPDAHDAAPDARDAAADAHDAAPDAHDASEVSDARPDVAKDVSVIPVTDSGDAGDSAYSVDSGDAGRDVTAEATADAALDAEAGASSLDAADAHGDSLDGAVEASCDAGCTLAFSSSPEWEAFGGTLTAAADAGTAVTEDGGPAPTSYTLGNDLGPAGYLCPGYQSVSSTCTPTASNAGARAFWIWRNDITPTAIVDFQVAIFRKSFVLGSNPSGTIQIDVNDFCAVFVNDIWVGQGGSLTDVNVAYAAQSANARFALKGALHSGTNTITVACENGPPSYAGGCGGGCVFAQNGGTVAFAGSLSWQ